MNEKTVRAQAGAHTHHHPWMKRRFMPATFARLTAYLVLFTAPVLAAQPPRGLQSGDRRTHPASQPTTAKRKPADARAGLRQIHGNENARSLGTWAALAHAHPQDPWVLVHQACAALLAGDTAQSARALRRLETVQPLLASATTGFFEYSSCLPDSAEFPFIQDVKRILGEAPYRRAGVNWQLVLPLIADRLQEYPEDSMAQLMRVQAWISSYVPPEVVNGPNAMSRALELAPRSVLGRLQEIKYLDRAPTFLGSTVDPQGERNRNALRVLVEEDEASFWGLHQTLAHIEGLESARGKEHLRKYEAFKAAAGQRRGSPPSSPKKPGPALPRETAAPTGYRLDPLWQASYDEPVGSLAFTPDGKTLAGSGGDKLLLWDIAGKRLKHRLKGHSARVEDVSVSKEGGRLASVSIDGTVRIWSAPGGELLRILELPTRAGEPGIVPEAVALSPDGQTVASGDRSGHVHVWNATRGRLVRSFTGPPGGTVSEFAWTPGGHQLASAGGASLGSAGYRGELVVREMPQGTVKWSRPVKRRSDLVYDMACSADGRTLLTAGEELRLYDTDSGHLRQALARPKSPVSSIACSPSGAVVAVVGARVVEGFMVDEVHLRDARSLKLLYSLPSTPSRIDKPASVAFSPDGTLLAVIYHQGANSTLRLWRIQAP